MLTMTERMLTTPDVLELLEQEGRPIRRSTWNAYVARKQAPAAAEHVGSTPRWSETDIRSWLEGTWSA
jgi:hypothetical protein